MIIISGNRSGRDLCLTPPVVPQTMSTLFPQGQFAVDKILF
jgi:hypothetical protein